MKQKEKTQKTKERILAAAFAEFGSKSYDTASINSICEAGQIPKGLLYHNFKGKEELYLLCVKTCYEEMTAALNAQPVAHLDARERLQRFLMARQAFFQAHPHHANIFFNAVLQPPQHLAQELAQLRSGFDACCRQCYLALLDSLTLREGITSALALEYFSAASEMFNGYFQKKAAQGGSYRDLIEDHEGRLPAIFDIMLYGIAKDPGQDPHTT